MSSFERLAAPGVSLICVLFYAQARQGRGGGREGGKERVGRTKWFKPHFESNLRYYVPVRVQCQNVMDQAHFFFVIADVSGTKKKSRKKLLGTTC